jgi:hypothetical protein
MSCAAGVLKVAAAGEDAYRTAGRMPPTQQVLVTGYSLCADSV